MKLGSNPADEESREVNAKEFMQKSKWIRGPEYLVADRGSVASTRLV